ncbi:MAG: HD domain-containing protein, partial [Candidatus Altiarchaeales archaeon HGW-Altiarchaeales-2]
MPDRVFAINLLNKEGADERVIKHCIAVSKCAVEIAGKISKKKNIVIDLNLVETGGLLHDLGRSKTHSV